MLEYTPVSLAFRRPYITPAIIEHTSDVSADVKQEVKTVMPSIEELPQSMSLKIEMSHVLMANLVCTILQMLVMVLFIAKRS